MEKAAALALLTSLRQQARGSGADTFGHHQLNAHLSLAYAAGVAPEAWEVYRAAAVNGIPATGFFTGHQAEIEAALAPRLTWALLDEHARDRLDPAKPGRVQYYDVAATRWRAVDVVSVEWFDSRETYREAINETAEELQEKVAAQLAKLRQKAQVDPTPRRQEELAKYEGFASGQFLANIANHEKKRRELRAKLKKLDKRRDFRKSLFAILRAAENEVRAAHGIAAVGEAWVSETELLYRVRNVLGNKVEVLAHGRTVWLGKQHLDIWIPSLAVAIEYHGLQHFQAVDFFGGEEGFRKVQERDEKKRALCQKNGVRLIEVAYDQGTTDEALAALLAAKR
jgi:hypothetical protein